MGKKTNKKGLPITVPKTSRRNSKPFLKESSGRTVHLPLNLPLLLPLVGTPFSLPTISKSRPLPFLGVAFDWVGSPGKHFYMEILISEVFYTHVGDCT